MVTSSSPSATTTLTGGGSLSASSNLSFTALREFFTCDTALHKLRRSVVLYNLCKASQKDHTSCALEAQLRRVGPKSEALYDEPHQLKGHVVEM